MISNERILLGLGVLPTSKEAAVVERALEIQRQFALNKIVNYIAFPISKDGEDARYDTTTSGITTVDFSNGTVKTPNSSYQLSGVMETCRSLLIFTGDADAELYLDGKEMIHDHTLWHLFEDINIKQLSVNFPTSTSNATPNAYALAFVASDKPHMSYRNSLFIAHDIRTASGTTGAAATAVIARHIAGYDTVVVTTQNTGAANSLNIYADYSADGSTFYPISGYNPKVVAAGSTDELDITVKYHFIRIRINHPVAATTYSVLAQMVR